jgi:hypothetical protein
MEKQLILCETTSRINKRKLACSKILAKINVKGRCKIRRVGEWGGARSRTEEDLELL